MLEVETQKSIEINQYSILFNPKVIINEDHLVCLEPQNTAWAKVKTNDPLPLLVSWPLGSWGQVLAHTTPLINELLRPKVQLVPPQPQRALIKRDNSPP